MTPNSLLRLLANLRMFKVTRWDEDSSITFSKEEREPATVLDANVVTSLREDVGDPFAEPVHALLIDLDVPAYLVPSSTQGHSHLYVDLGIPQTPYFALLDALADAGVIQRGYANSSKARGGTALRLPWVKKAQAVEPAPVDTPPFPF